MKRRTEDPADDVLAEPLRRFCIEDWLDFDEPVPDHVIDAGEEWFCRHVRALRRFQTARREALTAVGIDWRQYGREQDR